MTESTAPLATALIAEMAAASEQILSAYAGLQAIRSTTGSVSVHMPDQLAAAVLSMGAVIPGRNQVEVPGQVREVLAGLTGKSAAVPVSVPSSVGAPR